MLPQLGAHRVLVGADLAEQPEREVFGFVGHRSILGAARFRLGRRHTLGVLPRLRRRKD
jgi:hypothetical protein